MADDISKNTVVMLVVLTLAVSMIGTWAVLDEMSTVQTIPAEQPVGAGKVDLTIYTPQGYQEATQPPTTEQSANLGINIEEAQ